MSIYPQQFNSNSDTPSPMDYDLQDEKQRIAEGTEEIKKELLEKWQKRYANAQVFPDKLSSASREMIFFLLSFQNTLFYNDIVKKFSLNQDQRDKLPQIIWNICLTKNWNSLKSELQTKLAVSENISEQMVSLLNQGVLQKAAELSAKNSSASQQLPEKQRFANQDRLEKITLPEALKKYPEIGEQLLTSEKISLRSFSEPARPSIKNWLADYAFNLGHGTHSAIERGNFIFHSANGKDLSSPDRQKLAYLLKAYDENIPVTVNKELKQMILPTVSEVRPANPAPKPTTVIPPTTPLPKATTASPQAQAATQPQKPMDAAPKPATAFSSRVEQLGKDLSSLDSSKKPVAPAKTSGDISDKPTVNPIAQKSIPKTAPVETKRTSAEKSPTAPDASLKFSSPQKLPYEKAQADQAEKPQAESLGNLLRKKDGGVPPKNVVNLKR